MNLRDYSIRTRLLATTAGALALMLLIAAIALYSLDQVGDRVALALGAPGTQSGGVNQDVLAQIEAIASQTRLVFIVLISLAVVVMIPAGLWVSGLICRPLREAIDIAEAVAGGRLDCQIEIIGKDETAALMTALSKMQADLLNRQESDKSAARESARINLALDCVSTPLTISNRENLLVYMNQAAQALWMGMEAEMAVRMPGFSVAKMKQHSLADFFDDPAVRDLYRAELDAPRTLDVRMCGRLLRVTVTPVRDAQGAYLGRVSQWIDRTGEVAIEEEVASIIRAASAGDFSQRIEVAGLAGFFRQVSEGVNSLLETVSTSVADVGGVLTRLSHGDLTHKITTDYKGTLGQLKDDANSTVDQLRDIIASIKTATEAINTAAKEIASGNQDLSTRTEEQASTLEETASSMEQLTGTVRQNAENARQANDMAVRAQAVADKGGQVVSEVVNTMNSIHQASGRIADIIGVIDGIAFQTNILALNAAVEAARAGEQGRGFAVVASEVRSLAQRSAAAAKEIKSLINDSVDRVEAGTRQVDLAGKTMQDVVSSIGQVARLITEIATASKEQSGGIAQVSDAVGQMDEATQQNAALVEEAAAAAESLEEQARELSTAVAIFTLNADHLTDSRHRSASPLSDGGGESVRRQQRAALPASLDDEWAEF